MKKENNEAVRRLYANAIALMDGEEDGSRSFVDLLKEMLDAPGAFEHILEAHVRPTMAQLRGQIMEKKVKTAFDFVGEEEGIVSMIRDAVLENAWNICLFLAEEKDQELVIFSEFRNGIYGKGYRNGESWDRPRQTHDGFLTVLEREGGGIRLLTAYPIKDYADFDSR